MRRSRPGLLVVLLLAGLLASVPGVAEIIESTLAGGDCVEPCPGDGPDGKCSSSCDECTCCPRALSAVFVPLDGPRSPRRVETGSPMMPAQFPLLLTKGVFHPPRA